MELRFGGVFHKPSVRMLADMLDVVYDKSWLQTAANRELYYMFRDLAAGEDSRILAENDIRYDNTIIPAGTLGAEYVKTTGHYHPEAEDGLSYTEVYEVLEGVAHYLLQRADGAKVYDVVLVEAEKGDKIVIPPNYGHVTINPGKKALKMANLVSRRFTSDYEPYRKMQGAAYFELASGEFVSNKKYGSLPELRIIDAKDFSRYGMPKNKDLYSLIHTPKTFGFLNRPRDYADLFAYAIEE